MSDDLRVAVLAHGGVESITGIRARELTRRLRKQEKRVLYRSSDRAKTFREWNRRLNDWKPSVVYMVNAAQPGVTLAAARRVVGGAPFVVDTGDAIYEMARCAGERSRLKRFALWAQEIIALKAASRVVVRGELHQEWLADQGIRDAVFIPDGYSPRFDESDFIPSPPPELSERLRGKCVVGLMGALVLSPVLGVCYGWDLVEALSSIPDPDVVGLVIGDGTGREWLEERARSLGVRERVEFAGLVPYDRVPDYLSLFDMAVSTQSNNIPGNVRTTGKLPEYMASGRFVLASRVGQAKRTLPEEMLLDYDGDHDRGYPRRLAERIVQFRQDENRRNALAETLPRLAAAQFSYDVLSLRFERLVRELHEERQ